MPRSEVSAFILHLYLDLLCSCFLRDFGTHLFDINVGWVLWHINPFRLFNTKFYCK